jgi:hypothetical protein
MMKHQSLLSTALLLQAAINTAAFQIPIRNIAKTKHQPTIRRKQQISSSPLSKLAVVFNSKSNQATTNTKSKLDKLKSLKQTLALVTTVCCITTLLHNPSITHATTSAVVPLMTTPGGVTIDSTYTLNTKLSKNAMIITLALFLTAAFARDGFMYFRHLATRVGNLGTFDGISGEGEQEEEEDVGLAQSVDWDTYSHFVLDGKKTNKSVGVKRRVMNLFMRLNPWSKGETMML